MNASRFFPLTRRCTLYMGLLSWLFGCGNKEAPYVKRDGQWYFDGNALEVAANATVVPIAREFAMIDGKVYYRRTRIDSADAATFKVLADHYTKDAHTVFYCETYRKGQDYYLVKYDRVFKLADALSGSFRVLEQGYAVDGKHAYYEGSAIPGADGVTFEVLASPYARDGAHGYFVRTPIMASDGRTFVVLADGFSKDSAHVFYSSFGSEGVVRSTIVAGAQPASFTPVNGGYASDATHHFYDTSTIGDTKLPLMVLESSLYAKLGTTVFYRGEVVKGADAATFVLRPTPSSEDGDAFDAHRSYSSGKPLVREKRPN